MIGPIRQIEAEVAGVNVDDPSAVAEAEREGRIPALDALEGSNEKSVLATLKREYN